MNFKTIDYREEQNIGFLTINREEKLNALSFEVLTELKLILMKLSNTNFSIKGIIFTGEGDKAFIAGADIQEMSHMNSREAMEFSLLAQEVTELLEDISIPVIACVNGYALGGGCEFALSCDYIFATENAMFGQPEVKIGLIPGFGGCVRLKRYVGPGLAKEMIYTGKSINADEAKEIGLVNKVFKTKNEMISAAFESILSIMKNSPTAVSLCKQVVNSCYGVNTHESLRIEREAFGRVFETEDKSVGINAFLDKKTAKFIGR